MVVTDFSFSHESLYFSDYPPFSLHQSPLWCVHAIQHHSLYISHNERVLCREVELFNAAVSWSADIGFLGNTFCIDKCQDPRNKFNSRQVQIWLPQIMAQHPTSLKSVQIELMIRVWVFYSLVKIQRQSIHCSSLATLDIFTVVCL